MYTKPLKILCRHLYRKASVASSQKIVGTHINVAVVKYYICMCIITRHMIPCMSYYAILPNLSRTRHRVRLTRIR